MEQLDKSPEELEAESLRLHESRQKMNEVRTRAVEEMMKHPLTAEQMREQIRQHREEADRMEKREKKN